MASSREGLQSPFMIAIPFHAARLKLERASAHIATLERELDDYLNRGPIRLTTRISEDPAYFEFTIDVTEPVPVGLSTVIGDCIHNLRTSLDLLACELVRMNGGSEDSVCFPFAKDAIELEIQIKKRHLDRAHPDAVNLARAFQPYADGNAALRGVHDLDIIDKHRTLLPVAGHVRGPGMALAFDRLEHIDIRRHADGTMRVEHAGDLPIGKIIPASFKLFFPRGGPFAELEMLPTLYRLLHYFSRFIGAFETLTLGGTPDVNAIKF
jgi:hypothetical protein